MKTLSEKEKINYLKKECALYYSNNLNSFECYFIDKNYVDILLDWFEKQDYYHLEYIEDASKPTDLLFRLVYLINWEEYDKHNIYFYEVNIDKTKDTLYTNYNITHNLITIH